MEIYFKEALLTPPTPLMAADSLHISLSLSQSHSFFKSLFLVMGTCVCLCMSLCMQVQESTKAKGIEFLESEGIGIYEPPNVVLGTEFGSPARAEHVLNH